MDTRWSDYIQSPQMLYHTRGLRFREDNAQTWLPFLHVAEGMDVLEIGCAGGVLLHRVKQLLPGITATGLDRDDAHIDFAKAKTAELGLNCDFVVGDATALPFADNTLDLTFSHTVCEHIETTSFLSEQRRVLKPGGRIVVLSVRTKLGFNSENWKAPDSEEQRLIDKLWREDGLKIDREMGVAAYEMTETDYPKALERAGFTQVDVQFFTTVPYAPDNASVPDDMAVAMIEANRMVALESVDKGLRRNPDGLPEEELDELYRLVNKRYNDRLAVYRKGESLWDIATSTVLAATGVK